MNNNKVYLNSCDGRIFVLDDTTGYFKPLAVQTLIKSNLKIKKLSAGSTYSLWCILQNFELSLFVFSSDTPIKCQVSTYENQRRYNILKRDSFTSHLLPTDRYQFSSEDGLLNQTKDSFKLPSNAWSWDADWFTEQCTTDGWEYAMDFPAKYHNTFFPTAFVRRKKWLRNRTFNAYNHFIRIEPPKGHECIIDVSVGGYNIPFADKGLLSVWIVSNTGKIFYRENVSFKNVEGNCWREIDLPPLTGGVFSCTCSGNGELWCIKWDGSILIRNGITYDLPYGTNWTEIQKPNGDVGLRQLSISLNTVWALDNQGSVYYRKGVNADNNGQSSKSYGTKWINVPGNMYCISVSNLNQLWAIDSDHYLCYREDIDDECLSGKSWRRIELKIRSNSTAIVKTTANMFVTLDNSPELEEQQELDATSALSEQTSGFGTDEPTMPTPTPILIETGGSIYDVSIYDDNYASIGDSSHYPSYDTNEAVVQVRPESSWSQKAHHSDDRINFQDLQSNLKNLDFLIEHLRVQDNVSNHGGEDGGDDTVSTASTTSMSNNSLMTSSMISMGTESVVEYEEVDEDEDDKQYDSVLFKCCDATQCVFMSNNMPNIWISQNESNKKEASNDGEWRFDLLNSLIKRNKSENELKKDGTEYVDPLQLSVPSSWSQVDEFKYLQNGVNAKPCKLEIHPEQSDCGVIVIKIMKNLTAIKKEIKLNINEVQCATRYIVNGTKIKTKNPVLAIYTKEDIWKPYLFQASSERKLNEWLTQLSYYCTKYWSSSSIGEECNCNIVLTNTDSNAYIASIKANQIQFIRQLNGHFKSIERHLNGYTIGTGYNGKLWLLSDSKKLTGSTVQTDEIDLYTYENQRWNVLTGFSVIGLPTDRPGWSDETGRFRLNKEDLDQLPSTLYQWTTDWQIDHSLFGGTDANGWQYAIDFPMKYHPQRNNLDFVRRRRWVRKCRVRVQNTLWLEVPQIHQITSLTFDQESTNTDCVLVWATELDGNVLCSVIDVNKEPLTCKWQYVQSEIAFKYITIGLNYQIYGLSMSGHVYFRIGTSMKSTGTQWSLLEDQANVRMKSICAGNGVLWAVGETNEAYFRENVTRVYPEGTAWLKISDYIKHVSVNRNNQVYGIESSATVDKRASVLLYRDGVTSGNLKGNSWKPMLSLKWSMVSNRGT